MSGRKPLVKPCDLVYRYDGGLMGFYSCVHESVYSRQLPLDILPEDDAHPSLLTDKWVPTDPEKARRVRDAVAKKISPRALQLVETVFLSCLSQKESISLRFLLLGFEVGSQATQMLHHADVAALLRAERNLLHEAHLLTGFIRFSDYDGKLVSEISPKNFVLPFLADHFTGRFSLETFMIYDKTHQAALIHQEGRAQIVQMESVAAFEVSEEEKSYRAMWKQFYHTLSIKERENLKCRRSHMPKRFWENMTEMRELL